MRLPPPSFVFRVTGLVLLLLLATAPSQGQQQDRVSEDLIQLVQETEEPAQPAEQEEEPLEQPPPRPRPSERRRRDVLDLGRRGAFSTGARPVTRLARVPNMFGDFGTGSLQATLNAPPAVFPQIWNDGFPLDLFVVNNNGGFGADPDPAVPITVRNGQAGPVVTSSLGPGIDGSADGLADTYPIAEPLGSAPEPPGPGTIVYNGGTAVFVGRSGPNTQTTPVNGTAADGWNLIFSHSFIPAATTVALPAGGGAAVRRVKLAENNSPEPRDRILFNYSYFNDVIGGIGDVNRYVVGFEKTLNCGVSSIELRVPFASTLAAEQVFGAGQLSDTQFGNLAVTYKRILYELDSLLVSGGIGVTAPLAEDARLTFRSRTLVEVENETVHLLPFLGLMSNFNDRFFIQSFVQLDVDANGNSVLADVSGAAVAPIGVLQDTTLLFVDVGIGCWLYDNPCSCGITRIVPTLEVHYGTTLQDADVVSGNGLTLTSVTNRYDIFNLTLGAAILWRDRISVRPAMAIPLRSDDDEPFDYEALLQVNVMF